MDNNISDSNIVDKPDGNTFYEQYERDISTGNIDFEPFLEENHDTDSIKKHESSANNKEGVGVKVNGAALSQDHIESTNTKESDNDSSSVNKDSSNELEDDESPAIANDIELDTSSTDPVEDLVRELEANNKQLSKIFRKIARLAASIHIIHQRGITVSDLVDNGFGKDYAEKLLPQSVGIGLLVRLEDRIGKQYQYVLSNYVHNLNPKDVDVKNNEEILPSDATLILAHELSGMKYAYHNIHLITTLNYKEDYHALNWVIPSKVNKQKVKSFNLEPKRSVNFRVSPSGTVNISIECTYHPFEFHTAEGLMNFFGICGQIYTYLQLSTKNRVNVVPSFVNWNLQQFDYNKDLPTKTLKDKYHSKVINWSSKGVLRVYYLGVIFRIYCKMMPYIGECNRVEGRFSTKEKVKMIDSISRIATASFGKGDEGNSTNDDTQDNKKHPFTTLEEMLLNRRGERYGVTVASKNKDKGEEEF
jgi:hypothetical protein